MKLRALCGAAAVLVGVTGVATAPAAAQDGSPAVTLDRTGAKAGEVVAVRGTGWSGSELVYVEICGNGGRDGSRSCDQAHATLAGISPDGGFAATLTVAKPPVPCPCVVKVTSQTTHTFAIAALPIQDVPVVPLENQPVSSPSARSVRISDAHLSGRGPWTSWFGAGAQRLLRITVVNDGSVAVHDPPVAVSIGKGSDPHGVIPAPDLGTIAPGESVTIELPVRYPALSFGQHSAKVTIAGFATPVQVVTTTSTYPWALVALALALVQVTLLYLRNRLRDALARKDEDEPSDGERPDLIDLTEQAAPRSAAPVELDLTAPREATASPIVTAPEPGDVERARHAPNQSIEHLMVLDHDRLGGCRQAAEQALSDAETCALETVARARTQADEILENALVALTALDDLERQRRDLEAELANAAAAAHAFRHDVELRRSAALLAAADAQQGVRRMVDQARRAVDAALADAEDRVAQDRQVRAPQLTPVTLRNGSSPQRLGTSNGGTGFDAAIARAVRRALQP